MNHDDAAAAKLERKTQSVSMVTVLMLLVFLLQLWLITIALEAHMAAHTGLALPSFLSSAVCFGVNLWLLRYVYAIDRDKGTT